MLLRSTINGIFFLYNQATVLCFFVFEVTVGVYFPSMGGIKAMHVPEEVRLLVKSLCFFTRNIITSNIVMCRYW